MPRFTSEYLAVCFYADSKLTENNERASSAFHRGEISKKVLEACYAANHATWVYETYGQFVS